MHLLRLHLCGFLLFLPVALTAQWQRLPQSPDTTITDIASMNGNLFAMANGSVYHSTDHGQSWSLKSDLDSVYRLIEMNGMIFALSNNGFIGRWSNNTWSKFTCWGNDDLTAIRDTLYVSKWGQIFISYDTGQTWESTPTSYSLPEEYLEPIYSFGDTLFALVNVGRTGWPAYFSTNQGKNWIKAGTMPTDNFGYFYFCRGNTTNDVAVYHPDHINVSHDHGFHWLTIGTEVTTFIKNYNNTLLLGLEDSNISRTGLFKLSGNNLIQILTDTEVSTINGFAADNDYAYIATAKKGIWRTSLANINFSTVSEKEISDINFNLYPNPANEKIAATFSPSASGEIRIYNELGILRQHFSRIKSGDEMLLGSNLLNGVYTVLLSIPEGQKIKKLIIVR